MKKSMIAVIVWSCVVVVLLGIAGVVSVLEAPSRTHISYPKEEFPTIKTESLSAVQKKILATVQREWELQPPGTKYSEGVEEEWCADFVSWTMREAGVPLANPHSGSWRIPGVYTLTEYYQSVGRFVSPNAHTPQLGDVVLYAPESTFRQHTNIVLAYEDGVLTTIGGNENRKIRIQKHALKDLRGVVGYGVLP